MSYSFGVKAATKAAAIAAVSVELDKVVQGQRIHAADAKQAYAAAGAFIHALADDDTKDVSVSVNGYVAWIGVEGVDARIIGANVQISASLVDRPAAASAPPAA